jgi:hypothetical protein
MLCGKTEATHEARRSDVRPGLPSSTQHPKTPPGVNPTDTRHGSGVSAHRVRNRTELGDGIPPGIPPLQDNIAHRRAPPSLRSIGTDPGDAPPTIHSPWARHAALPPRMPMVPSVKRVRDGDAGLKPARFTRIDTEPTCSPAMDWRGFIELIIEPTAVPAPTWRQPIGPPGCRCSRRRAKADGDLGGHPSPMAHERSDHQQGAGATPRRFT